MSAPKKLGSVDLSAATAVDIFQGSAAGGTFTVRICNRSTTVTATVKLSLSTVTATIQDANLLEAITEIPPGGVLENTGLIWENASDFIVVESDVANVNAIAYGWEA